MLQRRDRGLLMRRKRLLRGVGVRCTCWLQGREKVLETFGIERGDELLETSRNRGTRRSTSSRCMRRRCAIAWREASWVHWRHSIGWLSLLAVAIGLGRRLLWRLMAPHALFLSRNKFDADLEVLTVVVIEFDVVRASAGAVEEPEVNQPSVLVCAAKTADGKNAFHELPTDDRVEI